MALLLAACTVGDKPAPALIHITVPSFTSKTPREIAKAELHAARAAPACLGTMALFMGGVVAGLPPWPFSYGALAFDAGASYLGQWCN